MGFFDRFKKQKGLEEILENGWQFYHAPTTLDPVGTVFRIDRDKIRYKVTKLEIPSERGKEAAVRITKNSETGLGLLVKFLEIALQGKLNATKGEEIEFKLNNPEREATSDVDVQHILPQLSDVEFLADSQYYIIRECRWATGMKYQLSKKSILDIGGKAKINASIKGKGKVRRKNNTTFEIPHKFPEKMRVMFLPAEIKPSSMIKAEREYADEDMSTTKYSTLMNVMPESYEKIRPYSDLATQDLTFELIPVTSQLDWEESEN